MCILHVHIHLIESASSSAAVPVAAVTNYASFTSSPIHMDVIDVY